MRAFVQQLPKQRPSRKVGSASGKVRMQNAVKVEKKDHICLRIRCFKRSIRFSRSGFAAKTTKRLSRTSQINGVLAVQPIDFNSGGRKKHHSAGL